MKIFCNLLKLKGMLQLHQSGDSLCAHTVSFFVFVKPLAAVVFFLFSLGVSDADKGIFLLETIPTLYYLISIVAPFWAVTVVHEFYAENIQRTHKWEFPNKYEKFFRQFALTRPVNRHYLYWVIWFYYYCFIVFPLWPLLFPIFRDAIFLVCVLEVVSFAWFSFLHALVLFIFTRFKSPMRYVCAYWFFTIFTTLGGIGIFIIIHPYGNFVWTYKIDYQLFIELFTPMLWWLLTAAVILILFSQSYSYRKFKEIHEC